jgi:hypothetical protein
MSDPARNKNPISSLVELFNLPASTQLQDVVQEAARRGGWTAPWDFEDKAQKKKAGKRSGAKRAGLAGMRRSLLMQTHMRLKPSHRLSPFSVHSVDALHEGYRQLLAPGAQNLGELVPLMLAALTENDLKTLRKAKRSTLITDLKLLGIRSKR